MVLAYGELNPSESSSIPQAKINGGLYTGEEATGDWRCFSVVPEAYIYTTQNLRSANPPPRGMDLIAGGDNRVGNSVQLFPHHEKFKPTLHLQCVKGSGQWE
jgi:hypothetical protein